MSVPNNDATVGANIRRNLAQAAMLRCILCWIFGNAAAFTLAWAIFDAVTAR